MKTCPQCKSVYTDDSLSFCLTDGTPLHSSSDAERFDDSEQTVKFPDTVATEVSFQPISTQPFLDARVNSPESGRSNRKVSPVWIFLTILLLGILIVGGAGAVWLLYFSNGRSGKLLEADNQTAERNGERAANENVKRVLPELNQTRTPAAQTPSQPTPTPISRPATYRVVGIRKDDVLFIRPAPNDLRTYLGTIPPDGAGIVATGPGRKAGSGTWYPITYQGTSGWVHGRYLAKEAGL